MEHTQLYNFKTISTLFDIDLSRDGFYALEAKNEIPPNTKKSENSSYRYWTAEDLAVIGEKFSTLSTTKSGRGVILDFYVSKGGGSHKTSDALNMAKYLAMHGKKVLAVPLDFQMNFSKKFGIDNTTSVVKRTKEYYPGVKEVMMDDMDVEDCIQPSGYPNLDLIPESPNLVKLEFHLTTVPIGREKQLADMLEPLRDKYDAIIIDNNPSWSSLSLNSLVACDVNVCSIGVDSNTHDTLPMFVDTLNNQLKGIKIKDLIFVPGFFEQNALKKDILADYRESYPDNITRHEIRKSTLVDEANVNRISIFEHAPKSPVCEDYKRVCTEIWERAVKAVNSEIEQ